MNHQHNLESLIKKIGIETTKVFRDTIQQQPNYPSMFCLISVLDELKINHISVKLQPEQLYRIYFSTVAHIQEKRFSHK